MQTKLLAIIAAGILVLVGAVAVAERGSNQRQAEQAAADAYAKLSTVNSSSFSTTGGIIY